MILNPHNYNSRCHETTFKTVLNIKDMQFVAFLVHNQSFINVVQNVPKKLHEIVLQFLVFVLQNVPKKLHFVLH